MQTEDVYKSGIRKNLNRVLRELTDDGKLDFESVPYQNLKLEIGKKDEELTEMFSEVLMETSSRSGCADRYIVLQLISDFFMSSRLFRNTILDDPTEFLELMVETNPIRNPLPGSKEDSNKLKAEAILVVKKWEEKYWQSDCRMKCLVVTLKKTKFVDYDNLNKKIEEERRRKDLMEERKAMIIERTLSLYKSKFNEIKEDVERLKMELETTMQMLVPSFTDSDEPSALLPSEIPSTSSTSTKSFEIVISDLAPIIKVSPENDAIVETFLGAKLLLIHRVQTLRKIAKRLIPLKEPGESLAQKIINYRDSIKQLVLKADEIRIKEDKNKAKSIKQKKEKGRFDDDFIDVEISIDDILMLQYAEKIDEDDEDVSEIQKVEKKKEKKIKEEPKLKSVPFGLDLKYWGEERKNVEVPKNNADCHRFWRSADESTVSGTVHQTIYTQRQFTFVGEAPKIDKECRAKLRNGYLCRRKDLHRCPLHGKIVDRDAEGVPVNPEDRHNDNERNERKRLKEAEEYSKKIMKDYESKTKRKKKYEVESTSSQDIRSRLQRKLLDPKTIQRVSADITSSQKNRLVKNFSHQFSHL
ncbi:hypothetical protein GCK72_019381 [Caenorhabditis remanei]|uniref:UV-stimulated scaffold protein A C-terminal domain-containing protein n=1 Tax=Caenorhabditis remanei TaxID=31234 RepID=A0A6A5GDL7_CAERE|nr:hypothetical protein GCK72_019381 [Caenorhabditis remanei]KAF1752826.1 hypothetical protein GCK72_019381 [Caenorhabditis remanei]